MRAIFGKAALAALCMSFTGWAAGVQAEESKCLLKEGGKLAIIGDSITEQKLYSNFMETYLAACHPELKQNVCQFGWGGDRAAGFVNRMNNDLLSWFKPDAATICFGMNDGAYTKINPTIAKNFEEPSVKILDNLKAAGTKTVLGGPGAVDTKYFRPGTDMAQVYNENLAELSAIAQRIAPEHGAVFAPMHKTLYDAMLKAKEANGADFDVCGRDGVHPHANGHLAMAYVFLKGLGVDGDVASLKLDMKDSKAEVSEGQKALSFKDGVLELESSRYPYCFAIEPKNSPSAASMLPFLPFNQELNRFMLTVSNLPWEKAKVTWGSESKTFTKAELEKGVNLSDYLDNPLKAQFLKLQAAVATKQAFETQLIKTYITNFAHLEKEADFQSLIPEFKQKLLKKRDALDEAVKASLVPVKSEIKIEKAE